MHSIKFTLVFCVKNIDSSGVDKNVNQDVNGTLLYFYKLLSMLINS